MNPRQFSVLFALGLIWGASFLFIKVLVDEIDPVLIVAGRVLFGVLVMFTIVGLRRLPLPRSRKAWGWLIFMGSAGSTLPFLLITWGETEIESGTAAVLNSTVPIFAAVLSIWFLQDEYLSPSKVLGLIAGFSGVAILSGSDLVEIGGSALLGDLAVVGASLSYGLAAIVARRHLRGENPISLGACQLGVALVILTPPTLLLEPPTEARHLDFAEWGAWLTLGFAGTGLAYWAYYYLIAEVGAVKATMVTYILPAVGVFLGWIVLNEGIGWNVLLGLALILVGIALVNEVRVSAAMRRPLFPDFAARRRTPLAAELPPSAPAAK